MGCIQSIPRDDEGDTSECASTYVEGKNSVNGPDPGTVKGLRAAARGPACSRSIKEVSEDSAGKLSCMVGGDDNRRSGRAPVGIRQRDDSADRIQRWARGEQPEASTSLRSASMRFFVRGGTQRHSCVSVSRLHSAETVQPSWSVRISPTVHPFRSVDAVAMVISPRVPSLFGSLSSQ